jgi:hypothetical protein
VGERTGSTRVAVLAALTLLVTVGLAGARPAPHQPSAAVPAAGPPLVADGFRSARTYPVAADPVRLRVPVLGVDSTLQQLDRLADGTVGAPDRPDAAGWYVGGPRPGQPGPAVILGHVDSQHGPGVFLQVGRLHTGAVIHVDRADGSTVSFQVTEVVRVPKAQFPTDLVYAPTLLPTLRLVTCGGSFDQARRTYRDNVIVLAAQA